MMRTLSSQEVTAVSGGDAVDGIHAVEVVLTVGAGIAGAAVTGVPIVIGVAATVFAFAVGTAIGKTINYMMSLSDDDDDDDD
jgi:hypothetical protein